MLIKGLLLAGLRSEHQLVAAFRFSQVNYSIQIYSSKLQHSDLLKFKIRVTVHNPQSIIYTSKLINNPQFTIYFLVGCWFLSFFRFTIQNPQFIVWFAQTNSIIHIDLFSESQIDLTFSKFLIYMFHFFFVFFFMKPHSDCLYCKPKVICLIYDKNGSSSLKLIFPTKVFCWAVIYLIHDFPQFHW